MSVIASVKNYVTFTGDQENELVFASGSLTDSPCIQELVTLASGDNTIDVPSVNDFTVHGLAIVPPTLNVVEPVLKGVNGDTGISLSATQVSVLQFGATPPASIVLNASVEVAGFRLIWF